jgi:Spy/CpxP family protein refolding chaperone
LPDSGKSWLFVVIAVAGLAIGFAASSLAYRYRWLGVPRGTFIDRMQHELNLTPEERTQILQIIGETRSKVMSLRKEFEHQRHEAIMQARAHVRALLTPEQQEKFDHEFRPPPEHEHEGGRGMHDGEGGPHESGPHEGAGPSAGPPP